jgi:hypothetical protein
VSRRNETLKILNDSSDGANRLFLSKDADNYLALKCIEIKPNYKQTVKQGYAELPNDFFAALILSSV